MKKWLGVAIGLVGAFVATAKGQPQARPVAEFVPGEVLVQYRRAATTIRRDSVVAARRARLVRRFDQLDIDHLQLASGEDLAAALAALRLQPDVAAVAPNYVRHAVATIPNDTQWASLWGMMKIQMPQAWDIARGDGSVVIMDIDTGLNYNHQDLAANVWTNPGETAANGLDDDHDGYIDDIHGIDTVNHDSNPIDDNGHGTHTAGTIAAVGNNATGVVGVNWNAKILPCKFLNAAGSGSDAGAAECLNYAVVLKTQHSINIRVTNNSWGGYRGGGDFSILLNAFAAAGNAGIISFVAAGNGDSNNIGLNIDTPGNEFDPASISTLEPSIVAVAASDPSDNRASFSNFGPLTVSLAAPGTNILSTYIPGNSYATASGTSMATPHVAGVAALLSSMDPTLNVTQLKALITGTVDVLPQWGGVVGTGGRLNAFAAVSAVGGGPPPTPTAAFVSSDSTTLGNWQGVYGGDGYRIIGDLTSLPAYATLTSAALTYTWDPAPTDARALKRVGAGRVAATWYADPSFDLDVNVTTGTHAVALYCLDWDTTLRSERVDVLNAATSAVLDTRTISSFNGGKYLSWNVSGHVKFRITKLAGNNAVIAGVFFGAAGAPNNPPTVNLTGPADNSTFTAPANVTLSATASDPDAADTIDHVSFFANSNLIGSSSTPVAGVYSFSWNGVAANNYTLTAQSFDNHGAPSAVSNQRHIVVNPGGGGGSSAVFVSADTTTQGNWQGVYGSDGESIVGDVTSVPAYAALSSTGNTYTWDPAPSDARSLKRVGAGRVAATWYADPSFDLDVNIANGTHKVALYCLDWDSTLRSERIDVLDAVSNAVLDTRTVSSFNGGQYVSWNITGHVKFRVNKLAGVNAVVAGIFFGAAGAPNNPPVVSLTGPPDNSSFAAPGPVSLTATASDPDLGDTIDHVSFFANGNPIGTSTVPVAGVYSFSWTNVPAGNYALTAQSFDNHLAASPVSNARQIMVTGSGGGASAVFVTTDSATHGSWMGVYGIDGQGIVSDVASYPAYATVTAPGPASQYTWLASTSDTRAVQRVAGGRVAATWYADPFFDIDINLTSGTHQIALYCLDWDSTIRQQRIDVLDAVSSAVIDTRTVTSFNGGKYLVWNVTGHVKFRVTKLVGNNAVVAAIFFGAGSSPAAEAVPTVEIAPPGRIR